MARPVSVEEWRAGPTPALLDIVDRLRALAAAFAPGLEGRIKWNAPSFAKRGIDRITRGLERKGGVRVVLHRGATAKPEPGFSFATPADLARWAAPDRGLMRFTSVEEAEAREEEIGDVFRRWMEID